MPIKLVNPGRIFFVALFIVLGFQVILSSLISYPPNQDQLYLIFALPIRYYALSFWLVKLTSLLLVLAAVVLFKMTIQRVWGERVAILSGLLVAISPTFFAAWSLHPADVLKVFLVTVICYWTLNGRSKIQIIIGLIMGLVVLVLLSNNQPFSNIPILTAIKPLAAEEEIKDRLNSEMSIVSPIHIPLAIKRIAYNKPYFIYKNILNTAISYGDLESVFFREVNSLGEKSFVIFFWPELILFVVGLFFLVRGSDKWQKYLVGLLVFFAFCDFVLLNKPSYQQFFLSMFPLSILISLGAVRLGRYRPLPLIIALILGYALLVNFADIATRPSFWFDNRPLAYRFIFQEVGKYQASSQWVKVTSLIGKPELYCRYYLGKCHPDRFIFDSFDLRGQPAKGGLLYAGFAGEYIGKELENTLPQNWPDRFPGQGLSILSYFTTRDTIAYHYGDTVVVAVAK